MRSPRGDLHERPEATDELEAVRGADLVVLGVKAYSLTELAPRIAPLLDPDAAILPAQNGVPWWFFQGLDGPLRDTVLETVDPGGAITAAIEPRRVVGCVPYPATEIVAPGVIQHVEGTRFTIGEPAAASARAARRSPRPSRPAACAARWRRTCAASCG